MNNSVFISLVRTVVVPTAVGYVVQFLVFLGSSPSAADQAAVTAVVAMLWYLLAKFLAVKSPKWGFLLLIAAQPKYVEDGTGNEGQAQDDMLKAVLRTFVPLLAGWAVTQLVRIGFTIDNGTAVLALQGIITSVYYGTLRWIEKLGQAKNKKTVEATVAGVMLGSPVKLTY